jgi:hypothetical protein
MADVSAKLIGIFATNLAAMLTAGSGPAPVATPEPAVPEPEPEPAAKATNGISPMADTGAASTPASTTPTVAPVRSEDSLNLLQVAGLPVLKRIAAPAGALLAVLAAVLIWRRRRRQ